MDYKFTIFNQTNSVIKVNASNEDKADWTEKKDPETVIVNAEVSTNHTFHLSGKMFASDPWFILDVQDEAGNKIASLYSKFDGNELQETVINDGNNHVESGYSVTRTYLNKDDYSYIISQK